MSATFGSLGKVHEQRPHVRSAGLVRLVAQRVNVGHQLIAQLQIFLEDRLRLLPVGPDFVVLAAAMGAEDSARNAPYSNQRV